MRNCKYFILVFTILLFVTCTSTKISTFQNRVILDKVSLKVDLNGEGYKAKGNISIFFDSIINFRFYGPLGFEVLKGSYYNSLNYVNTLEKRSYFEIENTILIKYNLRISRRAFEYFLLGNISNLKTEMAKLNPISAGLTMNFDKQSFSVYNNISRKSIVVFYKLDRAMPKIVFITLTDNKGMNIKIAMKYIHFSN